MPIASPRARRRAPSATASSRLMAAHAQVQGHGHGAHLLRSPRGGERRAHLVEERRALLLQRARGGPGGGVTEILVQGPRHLDREHRRRDGYKGKRQVAVALPELAVLRRPERVQRRQHVTLEYV